MQGGLDRLNRVCDTRMNASTKAAAEILYSRSSVDLNKRAVKLFCRDAKWSSCKWELCVMLDLIESKMFQTSAFDVPNFRWKILFVFALDLVLDQLLGLLYHSTPFVNCHLPNSLSFPEESMANTVDCLLSNVSYYLGMDDPQHASVDDFMHSPFEADALFYIFCLKDICKSIISDSASVKLGSLRHVTCMIENIFASDIHEQKISRLKKYLHFVHSH